MSIKIIYDKKGCIGAGECEVLSKEFWKVDSSGKAVLKGAALNEKTGKYELVLDDSSKKLQDQVCGSCPVGCIKIEKA